MKDTLSVRWETTGRGWEVIPPRYLYSATLIDHLRAAYIRFLKAASLATALKLTRSEIAHFAVPRGLPDRRPGLAEQPAGHGKPGQRHGRSALLKALAALLDFARIKAELAPDDERLLAVLKDPAAATRTRTACCFTLTRWDADSLDALLARFGKAMRRSGPPRRPSAASTTPMRLVKTAGHPGRRADHGHHQRAERRRPCAICRPPCAPATTRATG